MNKLTNLVNESTNYELEHELRYRLPKSVFVQLMASPYNRSRLLTASSSVSFGRTTMASAVVVSANSPTTTEPSHTVRAQSTDSTKTTNSNLSNPFSRPNSHKSAAFTRSHRSTKKSVFISWPKRTRTSILSPTFRRHRTKSSSRLSARKMWNLWYRSGCRRTRLNNP